MNKQTYKKLLATGDYNNKGWLDKVYNDFHPKRKGKYKMRIVDTVDLNDDISTGTYIDTAYFSNQEELSVIHHYYEGFMYEFFYAETGEFVCSGVIDGAPFDEVNEEGWEWLTDNQLRALKLIPLPEVHELRIFHRTRPTDRYVATAFIENNPVFVTYNFEPSAKKATEDLIAKYLKETEVNQW
jgi:hypothetical protein